MLYLTSSIVFSTSLLIIFKLFEKFDVKPVQAIGINYLTASIVACFFIQKVEINFHQDFTWIIISILLGMMFALIFNLSRYCTSKVGMSITSVAMKLGVLFPVILGLIWYNESFNSYNYLGLALGFTSIYFINKKTQLIDSQDIDIKYVLLPILVWIGSGICDSSVQYIQKFYSLPAQNGTFSLVTFGSAACFSLIYSAYKRLTFSTKDILGGIALGIPNYFSIYFLVLTLEDLQSNYKLSSANIFMLNNLSIVIASVLVGILLFKEKLNQYNLIGILICLISLYLINK